MKYDVAILGGGSAGYAAARTAAGAGLKTVVIEGGEEVGGLCILRGCMPTKALLYAAEVMHLASHPQPWGLRTTKAGFNFKKVMARKSALIKEFADDRAQQLAGGKFEFIRARARFLDAHTVELSSPPVRSKRGGRRSEFSPIRSRLEPLNLPQAASLPSHPLRPPTVPSPLPSDGRGEGQGKVRVRVHGEGWSEGHLTARHFVIATGSFVAPPPMPSLHEVGFITSDQALALKQLPNSLIVLGGGPVACEFTQFFVRFGVKVTQIQRSPHLLHDFDADAASVIETVFRREGVKLFTGTKLLHAKRKGPLKTISFECGGRTVSASAEEILLALGRRPGTALLGLEKAGVATEYGRIVANGFMQTSVPHIYAAGDCTGPYEIVHLAVQQGEAAGRHIANPGTSPPMDYRLLISVVFTEPQVAFVGMTEKEAAARGIPYLAASHPFSDHGKSLIMEARDGFVKLLADSQSGEIIGGICVGPLGGELIHEIAAAMAKRMTVQELAAMPHYHPTLAEIWTYPAEELAGKIRPQ